MYTIYTKDDCSFCNRAKVALKSRGLEFEERHVGNYGEEMNSRVEAATGEIPRTVPQIFNDEIYVGGFTELMETFK